MATVPILHALTSKPTSKPRPSASSRLGNGSRHVVASQPTADNLSIEGDLCVQNHRYATFQEAVERAIFTTTCQLRAQLQMEVQRAEDRQLLVRRVEPPAPPPDADV